MASLAALLTGLSYAELATMFPEAGAEYIYLRVAWPRFLGHARDWPGGSCISTSVLEDRVCTF